MDRLSTTYLGLDLRSPLVASASPLTGIPAMAERMQDAGAAAIVLPSLFEEEIVCQDVDLLTVLEQGTEHFAEALDYFPGFTTLESIAERYLLLVQQMKQRLHIPVIASLNATSDSGWVHYARLLQEAGADAIELNLYRVAADPGQTGAEVEAHDLHIVHSISQTLSVPLAVKLSPYYSALANFASAVVEVGAKGLVLVNRFYQPDIDANSREVVTSIELSQPWELRLPLSWTAILRPHLGGRASLALSSGVQNGIDAAKALLAGADVVMMTSAVLRHGPDYFGDVERELVQWMDDNEYATIAQPRGSVSFTTADDSSAFERANYRRVLHSWTTPRERVPGA
jgi:dihydroorotate dehydrogenase (fumarate)